MMICASTTLYWWRPIRARPNIYPPLSTVLNAIGGEIDGTAAIRARLRHHRPQNFTDRHDER
eukprot:1680181-Rhodomonas_salina.1